MKKEMSPAVPDLKALRDEIHRVHIAFLDALRYRLERVEQRPVNPTQWFMLITQDPSYSWFRPFTQLVTAFDILLDEEKISTEQIAELTQQTDHLFTASEENHFATRFFEMLPNEPDVLMTYHRFRDARAKLKKALQN